MALLLSGCMAPQRAVVTDVIGCEWRDTVRLTVPVDDTLAMYDLSLFLRYNNRFTADTFPVTVVVQSPDSLRAAERVTMFVTRDAGAAALQREAVVPYRRGVRFSRRGGYEFLLVPRTTVEGVEAVGICYTKNK